MTKLEIAEIFAVWALNGNWAASELFQGDQQMKDLRISLYAEQLSDIDYWQGLLGASLSLKTRRFPPNIAEFSEDIRTAVEKSESEISHAYLAARDAVRISKEFGYDVQEALDRLPQRTKTVLRVMGGLEAFAPPESRTFNMDGFVNTYRSLLRKKNALTGEKYTELPGGHKALPGSKKG